MVLYCTIILNLYPIFSFYSVLFLFFFSFLFLYDVNSKYHLDNGAIPRGTLNGCWTFLVKVFHSFFTSFFLHTLLFFLFAFFTFLISFLFFLPFPPPFSFPFFSFLISNRQLDLRTYGTSIVSCREGSLTENDASIIMEESIRDHFYRTVDCTRVSSCQSKSSQLLTLVEHAHIHISSYIYMHARVFTT